MPDVFTGGSLAISAFSAKEGADAAERSGDIEQDRLALEIRRDDYNQEQVEQTNAFALEDREDLLSRRDRERTMLDPVQQGIVDRANQGPDFEGAAARSDADVTQAFGVERGKMRRTNQRYGVNPSSGRMASEDRRFSQSEALAKVHGRNRSHLQEDDRDWARKIAALGTGNVRNAIPNTQMQQLGVSGASGVMNNMSQNEGANASGAFQLAGSLFADAADRYSPNPAPSSTGGAGVDYAFYEADRGEQN